jgi:FkbM family methyltransferase
MSFKRKLAETPILRRGVMKTLKFFERDISVTNRWTGDTLRLNSFRHKGYWYFGRERERESMELFAKLIHEGDTVIEAGGHIGFISQYFSKLVGSRGRVVVFEPGSNNALYIKANVSALRNTTHVPAAVGSKNGNATFYEDNVTGQNNSLVGSYRGSETTAKSSGVALVRTPREVDVVTIDSYVDAHGLTPNFLKIDVEGFEYDVLLGANQTLRQVRAVMVEVTMQQESVSELLRNAGFNALEHRGLNVFATR